jgi:hypothetical protein
MLADLLPRAKMMEVEDCTVGIENVFFDDEDFEIAYVISVEI